MALVSPLFHFHARTVRVGTRAGVSALAARGRAGVEAGWTGGAAGRTAGTAAGAREPRRAPVADPRIGPPPPERCADVTVHMLAGLARTVRIDVRSLGAGSVAEAERVLRARAARGGFLALRGHDGGLSIPGSMVRGVTAKACPAP